GVIFVPEERSQNQQLRHGTLLSDSETNFVRERPEFSIGLDTCQYPVTQCRASMKMSPFRLDRNVPLLRPEDPIPSCDDCAACSGTLQGCPPARATTARGLDGTRRKPEPHIPHKREWYLLESATGATSIEVRMGT